MWTDKNKNAKGHDLYPETVDALQNALVNLNGEWVIEVTIASEHAETFYLMAANQEKDWDDVDWKDGVSVMCVIRYGDVGAEKEDAYEMMVTFQTDEGENHKKELEIIVAMLYAWVEEKSFPNARMAVNVQDLLKVDDVQDYLAESNFPAYIRSRTYQLQ